jgi:hypothetical protein
MDGAGFIRLHRLARTDDLARLFDRPFNHLRSSVSPTYRETLAVAGYPLNDEGN